MAKKRIVKDYIDLPPEVRLALRKQYPDGYSENLIKFTNAKGKKVSALPFETADIYYLVRMTVEEAIQIVEDAEEEEAFEEEEFEETKAPLVMDDSMKEEMAKQEQEEELDPYQDGPLKEEEMED